MSEHPEEPKEQVRTILKESWLALLVILIATGLQYWLAILLASWLAPADYGDFEVAMTFSALLWLVALHGSEKSIFKFLPVYVDRKEWGHYHGFVRFHAAVAILFAGIIALVGTVLAIYPSDTLVKSGRDVLQYHPLLLALWLLPLTALANLLDKIPRLFHRMLLSLVPIKILLPLITLAILYGLRLYGLTVTDWLAVGVVGLAAAVVLAIQIQIARRLPTGRGQATYEAREWMTNAVPIMITGFLILAVAQVDLIMVEWLAGESDVGVFALAARMAMVVFIITHAVNAVMAPSISRALASGERNRQQTILNLASSLVFWPATLIVIGLLAFGGRVLELIGPAYVHGYDAMLILAIGYLLEGTIGFSKQFLIFSDDKRVVVAGLAMAVILDAILNAILIPVAGITGAAIATSLSLVVTAVGLSVVTWKRHQILPIPGLRIKGA